MLDRCVHHDRPLLDPFFECDALFSQEGKKADIRCMVDGAVGEEPLRRTQRERQDREQRNERGGGGGGGGGGRGGGGGGGGLTLRFSRRFIGDWTREGFYCGCC